MDNYGLVLFLVLVAIVVYLSYDTYIGGKTERVLSRVDQREYVVQSFTDKQEAADLLATIRADMDTLVSYLERTEPSDPRTQRLVELYDGDRIQEGVESDRYTSYSVNKGEKIILCIRNKDTQKTLVDRNTMNFVAIHELAHICTPDIGHPPVFWDNMRFLLEVAINIGTYKKKDYAKEPQPYCGMEIKNSPLTN